MVFITCFGFDETVLTLACLLFNLIKLKGGTDGQ